MRRTANWVVEITTWHTCSLDNQIVSVDEQRKLRLEQFNILMNNKGSYEGNRFYCNHLFTLCITVFFHCITPLWSWTRHTCHLTVAKQIQVNLTKMALTKLCACRLLTTPCVCFSLQFYVCHTDWQLLNIGDDFTTIIWIKVCHDFVLSLFKTASLAQKVNRFHNIPFYRSLHFILNSSGTASQMLLSYALYYCGLLWL